VNEWAGDEAPEESEQEVDENETTGEDEE